MNQVVELPPRAIVADSGRMSVSDVIRHVSAVQEVMRSVMKEGTHFGRIPGTDKPALFKQGAEVLCLAFKIGERPRVEDKSADGVTKYRVTLMGFHQPTGMELGEGIGECSSDEEKYKWRRAVCQEEFDATPPNLRRVKYGKKQGGFYTVDQVRVEPADVSNTVLKMATKRAKIAMTLNVTAASDMFSQDLEDLDEALREHLTEDEQQRSVETTRTEWVARATAAKSEADLKAVMREGVKVFQGARDKDGYSMFASAIQKRGAVLKGAKQEHPHA